MRAFLIAVLLILLTPAGAGAVSYTVIPPSNSGADQYRESVPTASGNRSATALSSSARPSAGSPLSLRTRVALGRQGRDGRTVARLTRYTAPTIHPQRRLRASAAPGSRTAGRSPTRAVAGALVGVDGSAGLGAGLLVILGFSAVATAAIAIRRRRAG